MPTDAAMVSINGQLSSRDLSCTTKLILYKTLILHVLLFDAKARELLSTDGCRSLAREKAYVRSSVQFELAMISVFDIIVK